MCLNSLKMFSSPWLCPHLRLSAKNYNNFDIQKLQTTNFLNKSHAKPKKNVTISMSCTREQFMLIYIRSIQYSFVYLQRLLKSQPPCVFLHKVLDTYSQYIYRFLILNHADILFITYILLNILYTCMKKSPGVGAKRRSFDDNFRNLLFISNANFQNVSQKKWKSELFESGFFGNS